MLMLRKTITHRQILMVQPLNQNIITHLHVTHALKNTRIGQNKYARRSSTSVCCLFGNHDDTFVPMKYWYVYPVTVRYNQSNLTKITKIFWEDNILLEGYVSVTGYRVTECCKKKGKSSKWNWSYKGHRFAWS